MNEALQLLITIGGAVATLSTVGGIIWKVALKPRDELRNKALNDIAENVQNTRVVTILSAKAIIAMADELMHDGEIDGKTVSSINELQGEIYKQVGGF